MTPSDMFADQDTAAHSQLDVRHLSPNELQALGLRQLAYVKGVQTQAGPAFAIHAADGTPLALATDRDSAFAAIVQYEMVPALVH